MSCIFCDIISKKIPAKIIAENTHCVAFHDISPQAPVHCLIIPKTHLENILEVQGKSEIMDDITTMISTVATQFNLKENGFRVITNTGDFGGQTVHHLHFHVMGGRPLSWPPG